MLLLYMQRYSVWMLQPRVVATSGTGEGHGLVNEHSPLNNSSHTQLSMWNGLPCRQNLQQTWVKSACG